MFSAAIRPIPLPPLPQTNQAQLSILTSTLLGTEDGDSAFGSTTPPNSVWSANLLRVHYLSSYQLQLITLE